VRYDTMTLGTDGGGASARFAALNAMRPAGAADGVPGAADKSAQAGAAESGFGGIFLSSFSGQASGRQSQKALDTIASLKTAQDAGTHNRGGRPRELLRGSEGETRVAETVKRNGAGPDFDSKNKKTEPAGGDTDGSAAADGKIKPKPSPQAGQAVKSKNANGDNAAGDMRKTGAQNCETQPAPETPAETCAKADAADLTELLAATAATEPGSEVLAGGTAQAAPSGNPAETPGGETPAYINTQRPPEEKQENVEEPQTPRQGGGDKAGFASAAEFKELIGAVTGNAAELKIIATGRARPAETDSAADPKGDPEDMPRTAADETAPGYAEQAARDDAQAATVREKESGAKNDAHGLSNSENPAQDSPDAGAQQVNEPGAVPGALPVQPVNTPADTGFTPSPGGHGGYSGSDSYGGRGANGNGGNPAPFAEANAETVQDKPVQNANAQQQNIPEGGGGQPAGSREAKRAFSGYMQEFAKYARQEAKLILDGEKNAFVMQLKPESLGKLTMKIVTEHGTVNAKFFVENESAKSSLEENLGQLKEALNGQGLQVQGCTVELRQGREQAQWRAGPESSGRRGHKSAAREAESRIAGIPGAGIRAFLRNHYFDQQSSVHYTA